MVLSKEQSLKIQVLRGLAIIAVVAIHCLPIGPIQVYVRPFINFAVGMFLFLSGLLSSADRWNPIVRLKKVLIPYVIWTFIYVVIHREGDLGFMVLSYVKALLTGSSAAIMYYIFVYCEFTLAIPLIDRLARSPYRWLGFVITPIEIVLCRLVPLVMGIEVAGVFGIIRQLSCLGWFTYFYLGYLIGNELLVVNLSENLLPILLVLSMPIQVGEGLWYYSMDPANAGTQLKLSAVLTGVITALIGLKYIMHEECPIPKALVFLGNHSFGIYFSHLAIKAVLGKIPVYSSVAIFPLNAVIVLLVSLAFVCLGRRLLGEYSRLVAF